MYELNRQRQSQWETPFAISQGLLLFETIHYQLIPGTKLKNVCVCPNECEAAISLLAAHSLAHSTFFSLWDISRKKYVPTFSGASLLCLTWPPLS